jgi:hypothetical protein
MNDYTLPYFIIGCIFLLLALKIPYYSIASIFILASIMLYITERFKQKNG